MSKLSKFFKNPNLFFKDSLIFNTLNPHIGKIENVFIVSHLNQLKRAEELIKYLELKNNFCIILWTKKNLIMPKMTEDAITSNLWSGHLMFLLPERCNNPNVKKWWRIKQDYKKLFKSLNPDNLYLQSYDNHYHFAANYAKKIGVKIHLLEEGTATYKRPEQFELIHKMTIKTKVIYRLSNLYKGLTWFKNYDSIYMAYPEYVKDVFSTKKWHKYSHFDALKLDDYTANIIIKNRITPNDMIFVNQRYGINYIEYFKSLTTILNKLSKYYKCKIFIKMHPKDPIKNINFFKSLLRKYSNLIMIEDNGFLVENTIKQAQVKGVIGLSSTSLVYANYVSPSTQALSITHWLLSNITYEGNEKAIEEILSHQSVITIFKHITMLKNGNIKEFPKLN